MTGEEKARPERHGQNWGQVSGIVGSAEKTFLIFLLTRKRLFGNVPSCRGAVAQLGERLNGIQEVRSSILLSSTKKEIRVCGNADPFFVSGPGSQTAQSRSSAEPRLFRIRLEGGAPADTRGMERMPGPWPDGPCRYHRSARLKGPECACAHT